MKITHRFSTGILSAIILAAGCAAVCAQTSYKFIFGGKAEAGWTQITPTNSYSKQTGYGFEPGATPVAVGSDALGADKPFYFSVAEPEGNYKVTVTFGSAAAPVRQHREGRVAPPHAGKNPHRRRPVRHPQFHRQRPHPAISGRPGAVEGPAREPRRRPARGTTSSRSSSTTTMRIPPSARLKSRKWTCPRFTSSATRPCATSPARRSTVGARCCTRWFGPGIAIANHAESGETLASSIGEQPLRQGL